MNINLNDGFKIKNSVLHTLIDIFAFIYLFSVCTLPTNIDHRRLSADLYSLMVLSRNRLDLFLGYFLSNMTSYSYHSQRYQSFQDGICNLKLIYIRKSYDKKDDQKYIYIYKLNTKIILYLLVFRKYSIQLVLMIFRRKEHRYQYRSTSEPLCSSPFP